MPTLHWRHTAAAGAIVTGIAMGMRDALGEKQDGPEVVVEVHDDEPEPDDPIVLYFHPEVPEATLVLLRRRSF